MHRSSNDADKFFSICFIFKIDQIFMHQHKFKDPSILGFILKRFFVDDPQKRFRLFCGCQSHYYFETNENSGHPHSLPRRIIWVHFRSLQTMSGWNETPWNEKNSKWWKIQQVGLYSEDKHNYLLNSIWNGNAREYFSNADIGNNVDK